LVNDSEYNNFPGAQPIPGHCVIYLVSLLLLESAIPGRKAEVLAFHLCKYFPVKKIRRKQIKKNKKKKGKRNENKENRAPNDL
jgi:hypothetical protein